MLICLRCNRKGSMLFAQHISSLCVKRSLVFLSLVHDTQLLEVAVDRSRFGHVDLTSASHMQSSGDGTDSGQASSGRQGVGALRPAPLEEDGVPEFSFTPPGVCVADVILAFMNFAHEAG